MNNEQKNYKIFTQRENFLMSLIHKLSKEYKNLLDSIGRTKPLKIIKIIYLSNVPGETKFSIQVTNKNVILSLSSSEIIAHGYNLSDFNDYHAEMIRQAAQGKLIDFLQLTNEKPIYKIISKELNRESKEYVFTIETNQHQRFVRTANELANDKYLLANMDFFDIYDIAYTQGSESILKEKTDLLLIRSR